MNTSVYLTSILLSGYIACGLLISNKEEACFGTGADIDAFWLNLVCPPASQISMYGLNYGAKDETTGCGPPITNSSLTDCCQYKGSQDCLIDVFDSKPGVGEDGDENWNKIMNIFSNCTGYESCYQQTTWTRSTGCNSTYDYTSFMMARYYCIPESDIINEDKSVTLNVSTIFLQNPGYMNDSYSKLSCSLEVPCDSSLELTGIDLQLGASTGTVEYFQDNSYQQLTVDVPNSLRFLPLDIEFVPGAKFWIQVKANDSSEVKVRCGDGKLDQPEESCLPTTTEELTTDTMSTDEQTTQGAITTVESQATNESQSTTSSLKPKLKSTTDSQTARLESTTSQQGTTLQRKEAISESRTPYSSDSTETSLYSSGTEVTLSRKPVSEESDNTGAIAGGVVGGIVLIAIVVAIIYFIKKKNTRSMVSPDEGISENKSFGIGTTPNHSTEPEM